jgi:hypothetical protein
VRNRDVNRNHPAAQPPTLDHRPSERLRDRVVKSRPIHLHGHRFAVSCTDGGWVPESAQWPETTIDVPVGAVRAFDMVADNPGDWAFHCHKTHHAMNAMGHNIQNFIGVEKRDVAGQVRKLVPDYMPMGSSGMADMGAMEMPLPENTLPMMTGFGQFGPIEMGGMFTIMKIREGLGANDYRDPGPYKNPPGTVAYEVRSTAANGPPTRAPAMQPASQKPSVRPPSSHQH